MNETYLFHSDCIGDKDLLKALENAVGTSRLVVFTQAKKGGADAVLWEKGMAGSPLPSTPLWLAPIPPRADALAIRAQVFIRYVVLVRPRNSDDVALAHLITRYMTEAVKAVLRGYLEARNYMGFTNRIDRALAPIASTNELGLDAGVYVALVQEARKSIDDAAASSLPAVKEQAGPIAGNGGNAVERVPERARTRSDELHPDDGLRVPLMGQEPARRLNRRERRAAKNGQLGNKPEAQNLEGCDLPSAADQNVPSTQSAMDTDGSGQSPAETPEDGVKGNQLTPEEGGGV